MKKIIINTFFVLTILFVVSCKKSSDPSPKISNHTFIASSSSWTYSSPAYFVDMPVAELNASNINSASVMTYFSKDNGSSWIAVPFTQYHSPFNYFMSFNTKVGVVQVTWIYDTSTSTGNDPSTFYSTNLQFKTVVISASQRNANPDVDLNNYEEVNARFGIE